MRPSEHLSMAPKLNRHDPVWTKKTKRYDIALPVSTVFVVFYNFFFFFFFFFLSACIVILISDIGNLNTHAFIFCFFLCFDSISSNIMFVVTHAIWLTHGLYKHTLCGSLKDNKTMTH